MKYKEYTLCDTTYTPSYDEYREWCKDMETQARAENSDEYWKFVCDTQKNEWDDLIMNVRHCALNFRTWVITPSLGLWDGRHNIAPYLSDSLESALYLCVNRDTEDVIVKKCGNHLEVQCLHHDGRNVFVIEALSDLGEDRFKNGSLFLNNKENMLELTEYLF